MASEQLRVWESLFKRAMLLVDSARTQGLPVDEWSFGGGTVLMRRHHHRLSRDIDIFINDRQFLNYLPPRVNDVAEELTHDYDEDDRFVKLRFPEGEIDFVAVGTLTEGATVRETILGFPFLVETSTEIVAKKVWYRGEQFTARDIFDLAMVAEWEPRALVEIAPILTDRREVILARIANNDAALRENFGALASLDFNRTYDECVASVRDLLDANR